MTKYDAINRMLRYIGESPVPQTVMIDTLDDQHEAKIALTILDETSRELQQDRYWFNTFSMEFVPNTDGYISIPYNVISVKSQSSTTKYLVRGNDLYDASNETKIFEDSVTLDVKVEIAFDDLPEIFKTYVVLMASKNLHMYLNADSTTQTSLMREIQLQYVKLDMENTRLSNLNLLTGLNLANRTVNPTATQV